MFDNPNNTHIPCDRIKELEAEVLKLKRKISSYETEEKMIIQLGKNAGILIHDNPDECYGCGCVMLSPACIADILNEQRIKALNKLAALGYCLESNP